MAKANSPVEKESLIKSAEKIQSKQNLQNEVTFEESESAGPPAYYEQEESSPEVAVLTQDNLLKLEQLAQDNLVVYFS